MSSLTLPARLGWLREFTMLPVLVLLVLLLAVFEPAILEPQNLLNVLGQSAVVAIAAIGATFVILTGGIDLSVGSTISASAVASAVVMSTTGQAFLGVVAGLAVGVVVGVLQGVLIARLRLVPFVVTLAGLFVVAGVTVLLSDGATISGLPKEFTGLAFANLGGIPVFVVIAISLYIIAQLALTTTAWGRRVMLFGASREASRISGSPIGWIEASVYAVAGGFSAIAGICLSANLFAANATMGSSLLLNIVGAVVLGGTSLFGGRGSIARTGIGVLVLGFLSNGMNLIGLASYDQVAVTGLVILAAACLDAALHRKRS